MGDVGTYNAQRGSVGDDLGPENVVDDRRWCSIDWRAEHAHAEIADVKPSGRFYKGPVGLKPCHECDLDDVGVLVVEGKDM